MTPSPRALEAVRLLRAECGTVLIASSSDEEAARLIDKAFTRPGNDIEVSTVIKALEGLGWTGPRETIPVIIPALAMILCTEHVQSRFML